MQTCTYSRSVMPETRPRHVYGIPGADLNTGQLVGLLNARHNPMYSMGQSELAKTVQQLAMKDVYQLGKNQMPYMTAENDIVKDYITQKANMRAFQGRMQYMPIFNNVSGN